MHGAPPGAYVGGEARPGQIVTADVLLAGQLQLRIVPVIAGELDGITEGGIDAALRETCRAQTGAHGLAAAGH